MSDFERAHQVNQKLQLVSKELTNADMYASYGNYETAVKLNEACIGAMQKMLSQTQDDPNFQQAIKDKIQVTQQSINICRQKMAQQQ